MSDVVNLAPLVRRVEDVSRQVAGVGSEVNALGRSVAELHATQQATAGELAALRGEFVSFLRRNELAQNKQLAQTELIEVRQTLETEYGHYARVRRSAVGTLQAMDAGVVTHTAIRDLSEELMISTPRYWLAPALVGLGAWLRDDRTAADHAVAEAVRRDHAKTTLFFALVLRRQKRDLAVAHWIAEYLERQDPGALQGEFRVVLDALASGTLGAAARPVVVTTLHGWFRALSEHPDLVAAQVTRWGEVLRALRSPAGRYPTLMECSPSAPMLVDLAEQATAFRHARLIIEEIFRGEIRPDPDLLVRVDAVLDRLTGDFDHDEAPLRRRCERLEAVIEHDGDEEAAERSLAARATSADVPVDLLTLLSDTALASDRAGASSATQRLAMSLSRSWAAQAADRLETAIRRARPHAIPLRHDDWHGALDPSTPPSALLAAVGAHMERRTVGDVDAVRLGGGPLAAGAVGGVGIVLAVVVLASGATGAGAFLLMVSLGLGAWTAWALSTLPARRQQARERGDRRRDEAVARVGAAADEAVRWQQDLDTALAGAGLLRATLDALDPDAHIAAADDRHLEVTVQ